MRWGHPWPWESSGMNVRKAKIWLFPCYLLKIMNAYSNKLSLPLPFFWYIRLLSGVGPLGSCLTPSFKFLHWEQERGSLLQFPILMGYCGGSVFLACSSALLTCWFHFFGKVSSPFQIVFFFLTYISPHFNLIHNPSPRFLLQTMGQKWYILIPKWHRKASILQCRQASTFRSIWRY